jgi:hypothetical protein
MAGLEDVVRYVVDSDKAAQKAVAQNPDYLELLKAHVARAYLDQKATMKGAALMDSWDRLTTVVGKSVTPFTTWLGRVMGGGTLGPIGLLIGGYAGKAAGKIAKLPLKVMEVVPKAFYTPYYVGRTGDILGGAYWAAAEAASMLPGGAGDFIAMTHLYKERAAKGLGKVAKRGFKQSLREIKYESDDIARKAMVDKLFADAGMKQAA